MAKTHNWQASLIKANARARQAKEEARSEDADRMLKVEVLSTFMATWLIRSEKLRAEGKEEEANELHAKAVRAAKIAAIYDHD